MPDSLTPTSVAPVIISLGGSLVVPSGIDTTFLSAFKNLIEKEVAGGKRFVIIVGGGKTARTYIDAAAVVTNVTSEDKDWLGIHATRINAHLVRTIFTEHAHAEIVTNPAEIPLYTAPLLIGAGYKPGNSTDLVAVRIARALGSSQVINLSNIEQVYTADPRVDPSATPLEKISWADYLKIIPETWSPGLSTPFDPVASREAMAANISVSIINGADLSRLSACLNGEAFVGTVIRN